MARTRSFCNSEFGPVKLCWVHFLLCWIESGWRRWTRNPTSKLLRRK